VSECRLNGRTNRKGKSPQRGIERAREVAPPALGDGSMNYAGQRIEGVIDPTNHDLRRARTNERLHDPNRGRRHRDVSDDRDGRHEGHRLGEYAQSALRAVIAASARVDDRDVAPSTLQVGHEGAPRDRVADAMRWRERVLDVRERLR